MSTTASFVAVWSRESFCSPQRVFMNLEEFLWLLVLSLLKHRWVAQLISNINHAWSRAFEAVGSERKCWWCRIFRWSECEFGQYAVAWSRDTSWLIYSIKWQHKESRLLHEKLCVCSRFWILTSLELACFFYSSQAALKKGVRWTALFGRWVSFTAKDAVVILQSSTTGQSLQRAAANCSRRQVQQACAEVWGLSKTKEPLILGRDVWWICVF